MATTGQAKISTITSTTKVWETVKDKWVIDGIMSMNALITSFISLNRQLMSIHFDPNMKCIAYLVLSNAGEKHYTLSNVVDKTTSTTFNIIDFKANNLQELLIKLDLNGVLYDDPSL